MLALPAAHATQLPFTENALQILIKRYLLKSHNNEILESPEMLFHRVAKACAAVESNYGASAAAVAQLTEEFYAMMANFQFTPAGRTLANAGGPTKLVANCIVLHIEDTMEDIFETLKQAALLQKAGSGLGFPLHLLRPAGSITKESYGIASGPISFLHVYNHAFGVIKQQNRNGANMAVMRVDHPDILEFIHCKDREGDLKNFNVSVGLTDDFMTQVTENCTAPWCCSWKGEKLAPRRIVRDASMAFLRAEAVTMTAAEIFAEIVESAWRNGEPGCIFLDTVNAVNPLPGLGLIEACNPCVTADTWIATAYGPRQVRELIGLEGVHLFAPYEGVAASTGFFSTGIKPIFRIDTKEGFTIRATANHRILTSNGWRTVEQLTHGETITISCVEQNWFSHGSEAEGYLIGMLQGDGTLKEKQAVISIWASRDLSDNSHVGHIQAVNAAIALAFDGMSYTWTEIIERCEFRLCSKPLLDLAARYGALPGAKYLSDQVESASKAFYIGYIRGMFDSDGSVQGTSEKGRSVRLAQSDKDCLQRIQRMLCRLGIMSRIYARQPGHYEFLPDGHGGTKEYWCKDQYELIISCSAIHHYARLIGFAHSVKQQKLTEMVSTFKRRPNADRFEAKIENVQFVGYEEVFDVTVNSNWHCYDSNGFISHNCGEQNLHDGDVCNLGAINLEKFVKDGQVNFTELTRVAKLAVQLLDNVIDLSEFPVAKVNTTSKNNRRVGVGIMGFADMLYQLGIGYGTQEGRNIASAVMSCIQAAAEQQSCELGQRKGVFPNWSKSVFVKTGTIRRNAALTNVAPTGTISMMFNVSGGVEPYFALAYYYKNILGGNIQLTYVNKHLQAALQQYGVYSDELLADIIQRGTLQHRTELPAALRTTFVTAMDVTAEQHVLMQAAFQQHCDNAISKTINFPNTATRADIKNGYILAWQKACKGCTVYRDGSRFEQVLNLHSSTDVTKQNSDNLVANKSTATQSELCPDCVTRQEHNMMQRKEGCLSCSTCGYSKCML